MTTFNELLEFYQLVLDSQMVYVTDNAPETIRDRYLEIFQEKKNLTPDFSNPGNILFFWQPLFEAIPEKLRHTNSPEYLFYVKIREVLGSLEELLIEEEKKQKSLE